MVGKVLENISGNENIPIRFLDYLLPSYLFEKFNNQLYQKG